MPAFALGFDFDHTLGFDHKLEVVSFVALLDHITERGGTRPEGDATSAINALLAHQRGGACTIDEAVIAFVTPLLGGHERDALPFAALYKEIALGLAGEYVKAAPRASEMLDRLAQDGVKVAILTNGWSPLQQRKAEIIGFHGPVLVSDQIGKQKPDPIAFHVLLEVLGTQAAASWYVGDNPAVDVAGALAAGMRAIWMDEGAAPYPPTLAAPTQTIRSLGELARVLEAFA